MNIEPIPKNLHKELMDAGVTSFQVSFSGGNDQGYLEVTVTPFTRGLHDSIYQWAENAYDYNGAGDGTDYGDEIVYNLQTGTVSHQEWCMQRHDSAPTGHPLKLK